MPEVSGELPWGIAQTLKQVHTKPSPAHLLSHPRSQIQPELGLEELKLESGRNQWVWEAIDMERLVGTPREMSFPPPHGTTAREMGEGAGRN